jgi:hypothetical protein
MSNNEDFEIVAEVPTEIAEEAVVEEIAEEVKVEKVSTEKVVEKVKPVKAAKEKEEPKDIGMVAIYSTKSVSWQGVGKVSRGYNIMPKEQADQWLKRIHTRLATPEEVRGAIGN